MITNEERIKEAFHRLQVEREIYLRVFNGKNFGIFDPSIGEDAVNLTEKRLKTAEHNNMVAIRWDDITKCGRCGEEGISEYDEKEGDDKWFPILQEQTDPDSNYYKWLLCFDCLSADDHYLANKDNKGRTE